jgi:hypothetical protein
MPTCDPLLHGQGVIGSVEVPFTVLFRNQSVGMAFSRQCKREDSIVPFSRLAVGTCVPVCQAQTVSLWDSVVLTPSTICILGLAWASVEPS